MTNQQPQKVQWQGKSGTWYDYFVAEGNGQFKSEPGNYIFARLEPNNTWTAIYIGQTDDLSKRLTTSHEKLPCARQNNFTDIHAHTSSSRESDRTTEESDLIEAWNPPCNLE